MKRTLTFFTLMLVCIGQVFAYDFEEGGIYYKIKSTPNLEVEVDNGDSQYTGEINIPSSVTYNDHTYSVTSIGNSAFLNCTALTSVIIPESVTSIESFAFSYCQALTSIAIPNSVTSIGESAFANCRALTSITIPNSVTSIEDQTFVYCTALTSITIPNSVTSIGLWAFLNCASLTSILIPESVWDIGDNAFKGCSHLYTITNLATNPQMIDNSTFEVYGMLHVLKGRKKIYDLHPSWNRFGIEDDVNIYNIVLDNAPSDATINVDGQTFANNGRHIAYKDLTIDDITATEVEGYKIEKSYDDAIHTFTVAYKVESAYFDFTNPTSLDIIPSSTINDAVEITKPITNVGATATITKGAEVTIDADTYLLNIDQGGSLVLTAAEPYKIVKVEFGEGEYADIRKLSATTGVLDGSVWTGEAEEVTFNVADIYKASAYITTIKVWVTGDACTFTDGERYTATESATYDGVFYTRTFNNTNWQALYVPFSMDYDEWSEYYDIAKINNFIEYDDDNNGVFDRTYLVVLKKTSGSTEPNYPYLIRAKSVGTHTLLLKNKTLEAAVENSIDCCSVEDHYTFTGTYWKMNLYGSGLYAMSGGALKKAESEEAKLSAQRWFMEITSRTGETLNKSNSIRILVDGEDTTDIEALRVAESASRVYDLSGRAVSQQPSAHGVYINGGKKVIK